MYLPACLRLAAQPLSVKSLRHDQNKLIVMQLNGFYTSFEICLHKLSVAETFGNIFMVSFNIVRIAFKTKSDNSRIEETQCWR